MGYYSYFNISMHDGSDFPEGFKDQLEKISDYRFDQEDPDVITSSDSYKWYEHETHMTTLSTMYPDKIIEVYRDGEESDDECKYYYLDGQSESHEVVKTFAPPTLTPRGPKFGTAKSLT